MKPFVEDKSKPLLEDYLDMMRELYGDEATTKEFEEVKAKIYKIVDTFPAAAKIDLDVFVRYRIGRELGKDGTTKYMKPIPIKKFTANGVTLPDDISSLVIMVKPKITMPNNTKTRLAQDGVVDTRKILIGNAEDLVGRYAKYENDPNVQAFTIEDIQEFSELIRFDAEKKYTV